MNQLESSLLHYFRRIKIKVSNKYITHLVTSHPDYPALTSVTDVLDVLQLQSKAVAVDKSAISTLQYPLLAHTNKGTMEYVESEKQLQKPAMVNNWSGVVLMVQPNQVIKNKANNTAYKKEQKANAMQIATLVLLCSLTLFSVVHHSIEASILLGTYLVGIFIAVLIFQQEQGIVSTVTEALCKKEEDCNSVVNSKGASILWGIKWSDMGLIYFITIATTITASGYMQQLQQLLPIINWISILSMPFIIFSLYYQRFVVKKWCTLCLIVLALLVLQLLFIFVVQKFSFPPLPIYWQWVMALVVTGILTSCIWLIVVKPFVIGKRKLQLQNQALQKVKNNIPLFINTLTASSPLQIPVQQNDIQLANPNAPIQLIVACNPHCGPCVNTHFDLEAMLHYAKDQIGLTIHFMANHTDKESARTNAVNAIYNIIDANNAIGNSTLLEKILHYWFSTNDLEKFIVQIKSAGMLLPQDVQAISALQKSDTSTWDKQIEYTPTLLINGYKLPEQYSINSVIQMLLPLINDEYALTKIITDKAA